MDHDSQELEDHTWRETEVERGAEGHYPHLGAPFTSFSPARRREGLRRHLLVDETHIGVSLKHGSLHNRTLLRIHSVTTRGPLQTASRLHCCGSDSRFGLEAAQSNYVV